MIDGAMLGDWCEGWTRVAVTGDGGGRGIRNKSVGLVEVGQREDGKSKQTRMRSPKQRKDIQYVMLYCSRCHVTCITYIFRVTTLLTTMAPIHTNIDTHTLTLIYCHTFIPYNHRSDCDVSKHN